MPHRVLITEAGSLVASHTMQQMQAAGMQVTAVASEQPVEFDSSKQLAEVAGAEYAVKMVAAHHADKQAITRELADKDCAIYLAQSRSDDSLLTEDEFTHAEIQRVLTFLQSAALSERLYRVVMLSRESSPDDEGIQQVEAAARDYMEHNRPDFDLVVIAPPLIIGPLFSSTVQESNSLLVKLCNNSPGTELTEQGVFADARDIARSLVEAMEQEQANGRYEIVGGQMSSMEMAGLMNRCGYTVTPGESRPAATVAMAGILAAPRSHKTQRDLGLTCRPLADSVCDTLVSLEAHGHLKPCTCTARCA